MPIPFDEKGKPMNLVGRTPYIYNLLLETQNTEYELELPEKTMRFTLQARTSEDVKLSTEETHSDDTYITIKAGSAYTEEGVCLSEKILYMQCGLDNVTVEVIAWTY